MKKGLWKKMYFWRTQNTQNTQNTHQIYNIILYTYYANENKNNDGKIKGKKNFLFFPSKKGLLICFKTNISTDFFFLFSLVIFLFSLDDGRKFPYNFDEGLLLIEFFVSSSSSSPYCCHSLYAWYDFH